MHIFYIELPDINLPISNNNSFLFDVGFAIDIGGHSGDPQSTPQKTPFQELQIVISPSPHLRRS